jgi:hypothetical protein
VLGLLCLENGVGDRKLIESNAHNFIKFLPVGELEEGTSSLYVEGIWQVI